MGICASCGYSINAAINDHRIKAVGIVSAVNTGGIFGNGWDGKTKDTDALPTLILGGKIRSGDAKFIATGKGEIGTFPFGPTKKEEAWEYYRTSHA